MNNIKQEIESITIPKGLHERSKLGVKKAKSELPKRRYKTSLIAAAMASLLSVGLLTTPSVQAVIEDLFSFNQVETIVESDLGYTWGGIVGDDSTVYSSIEEIESQFSLNIPFPDKFQMVSRNANSEEYKVETLDGDFLSFGYFLRTNDRMYRLTASNVSNEKPNFSASTTENTVIEKEVMINGESQTLIGIHDINGYHLYIEQGDWKIVLSGFEDQMDGDKGVYEIREEEIITIVETLE